MMHSIASQIRALEADVAEVYELLALRDNPTFTGTVSGLNKTMVGLSNVDNTSDAEKPISTKTKAALDLKANANDVYTKDDTDKKITDLINGAPGTLDTLKELAAAINNDANYAGNMLISLATKADKNNPTFTGTVNAPTVKVSNKYVSGTSTDYIEMGYDDANTRSFINFVQPSGSSNDKLSIRQNDNNVATFTASGNFGINTASPGNAKLQIVGGVQNVANEETAIKVLSGLNNVKIELESTATNGKRYEIRSTNSGSFDITDRTGSATRYAISSSGAHTITGSATITGNLAIDGVANVASSLATKQNLVNPVVDIPDWLRLDSDHFEYVSGIFGDPPGNSVSRYILTLKTASLPYAPTNNPVLTGNASIAGNLDIGGELSVK